MESEQYEPLAVLRLIPRVLKQGRGLAFSNEAAEAFKNQHPIFDKYGYKTLYAISFGFIGLDITYNTWKKKEYGNRIMAYKAADLTAWHGLASLALPGIAVHKVVSTTKNYVTMKQLTSSFARRSPIVAGLVAIPIVVPPIDHGVEWLFDKFIRPLYPSDVQEKLH